LEVPILSAKIRIYQEKYHFISKKLILSAKKSFYQEKSPIYQESRSFHIKSPAPIVGTGL